MLICVIIKDSLLFSYPALIIILAHLNIIEMKHINIYIYLIVADTSSRDYWKLDLRLFDTYVKN